MNYPVCKKTEYQEEYFGHRISDPYRWLTDGKNPEVLEWVKKENEYTDAWFDEDEVAEKAAQLKAKKLKSLYQMISPWGDGFGATKMTDGIYSVVRLDAEMKNETLVMERDTVPDFTAFEVKICPADENKIAVYGLYDGDARPTVLVIDCLKKEILSEIKESFSCVWSKTKPVFYYSDTESDAASQKSTSRVCGYNVLTGGVECIFKDEKYSVIGNVAVSSDGKYLIFEMMNDYSHSRFYSYEEATGKMTDISEGNGLEMKYVDSMNEKHYFISKENTSFGEVLAVQDGTGISKAEVIRPAGQEVLDIGFTLKEKLYIMAMADVCTKMICLDGEKETEVELPSKLGTAALCGHGKESVFLKFESFVNPPMLLEFDGEEMEVLLRSSDAVHPDVVVERKFAPSMKDGKMIPYFIVRRKDVVPNGKNPTWMYAYGGYNIAMVPGYEEQVAGLRIAEWAEKGGIYVLCSIRGGNEYGSQWHMEGMAMQKKNCYYDFIGIAEQMVKEAWTKPEKIAISGCSNGGLLVSTLVTMRPDLFGCVIDSVPHTDMIQFAEDDRGPMYITEYGNPRESKEMFEYLLSYSPYHNVKKVNYPWVYIQTGECDNNVPPYHGKKFAARMQEENQSENPILLRVLEKGSHDRGAGEVYWRTTSEMQLFVEKALGI